MTQQEIWVTSRQVKGGARSDIVLPLAAWRGQLGVNWQRARELFDL